MLCGSLAACDQLGLGDSKKSKSKSDDDDDDDEKKQSKKNEDASDKPEEKRSLASNHKIIAWALCTGLVKLESELPAALAQPMRDKLKGGVDIQRLPRRHVRARPGCHQAPARVEGLARMSDVDG